MSISASSVSLLMKHSTLGERFFHCPCVLGQR